MVYREGGRAPVFKHAEEVSAAREARRIADTSGEKTYVLVSMYEFNPRSKPTPEEVRRHAEMNGKPLGACSEAYGLWRVRFDERTPPAIVAIDVTGRVFSPHWPLPPDLRSFAADTKWWPLDDNGKDITDEIPF
jgi:hypothetical protein